MDSEATVHARAVNANENGIGDRGPGRPDLAAVEAAVVLFFLAHPLEYGHGALVFHLSVGLLCVK